VRFLPLALVLAALAAAPAQARHATCGVATARVAVAATKVKVLMLGDQPTRVDPKLVDQVLCFDFTRDGRADMAVSIASGGTAGDIGYVVFRATPPGWNVALKGGGYKLGLHRAGEDPVVTQPVYNKNDPNCCPTGGFDHVRYHWNGSRFAKVRAWHTKTFRP
jgi:hypothetical protein